MPWMGSWGSITLLIWPNNFSAQKSNRTHRIHVWIIYQWKVATNSQGVPWRLVNIPIPCILWVTILLNKKNAKKNNNNNNNKTSPLSFRAFRVYDLDDVRVSWRSWWGCGFATWREKYDPINRVGSLRSLARLLRDISYPKPGSRHFSKHFFWLIWCI